MYFKIENIIVEDLFLTPETKDTQFNCGEKNQLVVILRPPTKDDLNNGYKEQNAFCSVIRQQEPNTKVKGMFQCLSNNQMPEGSNYPESAGYIASDGKIKTNYNVHLRYMPEPFQSFYKQIYFDMYKCLTDTIKLIRWRSNIRGSHNPFSSGIFYWSFDGQQWYQSISSIKVSIDAVSGFTPSESYVEEIVGLKRDNIAEPLSHEIYREAWGQRHGNPRSALVIGLSALEIGFKHCSIALLPYTQWIIENAQSPPIVKMLEEYLPQLPAIYKFDGKVLSPPDEAISCFKKAIQIRNLLVHTGNTTLEYEFLEKLLPYIKDTLWMFDYYCGFEWALGHIRPETIEKLTILKNE